MRDVDHDVSAGGSDDSAVITGRVDAAKTIRDGADLSAAEWLWFDRAGTERD